MYVEGEELVTEEATRALLTLINKGQKCRARAVGIFPLPVGYAGLHIPYRPRQGTE
jgi:hypothetical protein